MRFNTKRKIVKIKSFLNETFDIIASIYCYPVVFVISILFIFKSYSFYDRIEEEMESQFIDYCIENEYLIYFLSAIFYLLIYEIIC